MQTFRWLLPGLATLLVVTQAAVAAPHQGAGDGSFGNQALVPDLAQVIDVNEALMFVTNQGSWAYDQLIGDAGMEWPIGSGRHTVFASGLWLGATVNGETRVTVGEFSQEFAAGPLDATGTPVDPMESDPQWKVLKVNAGDDAANPDWLEWRRLGGLLGEDGPPLDEAGDPAILGDQSLWCVYNDAVPEKHTNDAGTSTPLGVEVRQNTFAFNRTGALGKTIFLDLEIENKGSNLLEDMYISLWFDPDLGGFTDDLVGSDTDLSLGFCYNATNNDGQYGSHPPALGCDFFLGPQVDDGMGGVDTLGMTSFNKYINGTDPQSRTETYNYMQGLLADGMVQLDCDGLETKFVFTGDPSQGQLPGNCLDSDPADRRFMMTTGPITMQSGDTQRIVAAIIVGGEPGKGDRLSNVDLLKFYDLSAQDAFDRNFEVPSPPPPPQVSVAELDGEVILSWGSTSQNDYEEEGYEFEGYSIWQGETANGPYRRLATFDDVNGIAIIRDTKFNPDAGGLEVVIVQQGGDTGIQQELVITEDAIRGGPLRNATTYHFAVTAYAYGADAIPGSKTLENRIESVQVVPQNMVSGVDLSMATISDVSYEAVDSNIPPATNVPHVTVVDPTRVTGHRYQIDFAAVDPYEAVIAGATYPVTHEWSVRDLETGELVLENQANLTNNANFDVFDGIQVRMEGVYFNQIQDASYQNNDATNGRGLSWVDWGGRFFGGAVDSGCSWSGSTIIGEEVDVAGCPDATLAPERFGTVVLRFNETQKGYRYFRQQLGAEDSGSPTTGRAYTYAGYDDVQCTVWKVVGDTETQLQVMYTERAYADDGGVLLPEQPESQDALWKPTSESDGGREYMQILDVPYGDGTPDAQFETDGIFFDGMQPLIYGTWFRQRGASGVIDPDDTFTITWGNPASENDKWVIETASATGISGGVITGDGDLAKARNDIEMVRAVPNPYLTRSAYELSQFNRLMKFINLPAKCTLRIFTLAGDLIETIEKDDATTSVVEWDLETRFGLPVGSGIYVFHVEAPGIGNTFGKFAVIMEKERLEDF